MNKNRMIILFLILFFGYGAGLFAITVEATLTADNYYSLAYGNEDGSVFNSVGDSLTIDWDNPDTYTFDVNECDYIYVAAWSDGGVAQGLIGQFVSDSGIILTNTDAWQVCSTYKPFSSSSFSSDISLANWGSVDYSAGQGEGIWGVLSEISLDAQWIWPVPLSPGNDTGEYHLFRTRVAYSPVPIADTGEDVSISMDDLPSTVIYGRAIYEGTEPIQYRWLYGETILLDWIPVGGNKDCLLICSDGMLELGTHMLTLQVSDGLVTSSDNMTLIIGVSPIADAGEDITISCDELASTIIYGSAIYLGTNSLQYRWVCGDYIFLDWTSVGADNQCWLYGREGVIPPGTYTLTLEVSDGQFTSSDTMVLTVESPALPLLSADAGEDITITYEALASTILYGSALYTGTDSLQYRWLWDEYIFLDWTSVGADNQCWLYGREGVIPPGTYILTLEVSDGELTSTDTMVLTVDSSPSPAPVADAGEDISVFSEDVTGIIYGTVSYEGSEPLVYRWLWGETVFLDWTPVGQDNACTYISENTVIPPGMYIFTLEVADGLYTSSDTMTLTIINSAPHASILGGPGVYEIDTEVILTSEASDFDGDLLNFAWKEGDEILSSGSIQSLAGGAPVTLPGCIVSVLDLGTHYLTLELSDGINDIISIDAAVEVVDTLVPTLAPVVSTGILWPPNHQMAGITIYTNASDNSGLPVTISAYVKSNEPEEGLGDGDVFPDWTDLEIDQETGIITLHLRSERSGTGDGREYTITIEATDSSGNFSLVKKTIIVPHDKSKK